MRKRQQNGSAVVIVLVIIIVVLIGALGYVFWKNAIHDTKKTPSHTTTHKTSDEAVKTTQKCLETEKLCFDIPENWKMEQTTVPATSEFPARGKATLYADGGKVRVLSVDSGITGVGGACDPATKSTLTVSEVQKTKATSGDTPAKPVYAVKAIYHDPTKGYVPMIFLSSGITHTQTTPECHPELSALYESKHTDYGLVGAGNYTVGDVDLEYLSSKGDVDAVFASQNYTEGFKVLESAHYQ